MLRQGQRTQEEDKEEEIMKYNMDFNFPYDHVMVRGLNEETMNAYSRKMEYEVPFWVTWTVEEWNQTVTTHWHIINPNMVTHVEIREV